MWEVPLGESATYVSLVCERAEVLTRAQRRTGERGLCTRARVTANIREMGTFFGTVSALADELIAKVALCLDAKPEGRSCAESVEAA